MHQVHMILQGKGGVGKSLIATLLAQCLREKSEEPGPGLIDTDPLNATFHGYRGLGVEHLQLLDENNKIIERRFDAMMERILTEDRDFVVDNGSPSFLPVTSYLIENDVPRMIADSGKQLVVHTIVTGGANLIDNIASFADLVKQMPAEARIIVWENSYFGPVEAQGKRFQEMAAFLNNRERIHGLIQLERHESDTYREDLELLFKSKLTFDEALTSDAFGVMPRQRLKNVRKKWFERIRKVL